jgi:hypothetical protein
MRFAHMPVAATHLFPGMYSLNDTVVERRQRAGDQQWFFNVGVDAWPPIPQASGVIQHGTSQQGAGQ